VDTADQNLRYHSVLKNPAGLKKWYSIFLNLHCSIHLTFNKNRTLKLNKFLDNVLKVWISETKNACSYLMEFMSYGISIQRSKHQGSLNGIHQAYYCTWELQQTQVQNSSSAGQGMISILQDSMAVVLHTMSILRQDPFVNVVLFHYIIFFLSRSITHWSTARSCMCTFLSNGLQSII
jgi:hypothetical protein